MTDMEDDLPLRGRNMLVSLDTTVKSQRVCAHRADSRYQYTHMFQLVEAGNL